MKNCRYSPTNSQLWHLKEVVGFTSRPFLTLKKMLSRRSFGLQIRPAGREKGVNVCFWQVSSVDSSVFSRCLQFHNNFNILLIHPHLSPSLKTIDRHLTVGHECCRLYVLLANSVPPPGWYWPLEHCRLTIVWTFNNSATFPALAGQAEPNEL